MIEQALQRMYDEGVADTARRERSLRRRMDLAFIASSLILAFGIMPFVYAVLLVDISWTNALTGDSLAHILLNCCANALVMVWALRLVGRFDRKFAGALSRVLIVHGALALWVLVGRHSYSNQVVLMAAAASALFASLIVLVKHRAVGMRAAFIGPWHPLVDRVLVPCECVSDSNASLAGYDVVLTSNVTDLPPEWAATLSRAMLMGKPVRLIAEFIEETQGIVSLEHFDLEHLPEAGLTSYRTRKRLMDVGLVLLALPVALPALLVGCILVFATMGRPIFFVQSRVGLGGAVFQMFKLRTMHSPVIAGGERATSSRDDARITPVGRWMRRFRIDELPQLWNVLIGDMSVIGPRPEWTVLSESYMNHLPAYAYRHLVRPGITGWAQVRGGYAADLAETRAKVGYDLFYIKNLSFSLDVQILVRTIWTLLSGSGAR